MSLKGTAKETLAICKEARYVAPSGKGVSLGDTIARAASGTRLYTPAALEELFARAAWSRDVHATRIDVTGETTQQAGQRLASEDPVALNFASARNPGGGFLNGAKAQEEDVARCSALYPCLLGQPLYYEANRENDSLLYTDHIIYSPRVPFFRVRNRELIEEPFSVSILTAPAPNAGQELRLDATAGPRIDEALRRRAGYVLAIAAAEGHRTAILGAWGCGVFRNEPSRVADAFGAWLEGSFRGVFEHVVFAILDRTEERSFLGPFEARFAER
jgi:uncharacterized protein (TIGR02452 family)